MSRLVLHATLESNVKNRDRFPENMHSAQPQGVMQFPGPVYPQSMSVVGMVVKWFGFLFFFFARIWVQKENSHFCFIREGGGGLFITDTNGRFFLESRPVYHILL